MRSKKGNVIKNLSKGCIMIILLFIFFFILYISSCNRQENLETKNSGKKAEYSKETREKVIENAGQIKYISENISKLLDKASNLKKKNKDNKKILTYNQTLLKSVTKQAQERANQLEKNQPTNLEEAGKAVAESGEE